MRPARAFVAAVLVALALLTAVPGSAAALEPPRPLPGYRPTFVTETDTHPWTDCLWASGAMLLDKWTAGGTAITRRELRLLWDGHSGGAALGDLRVAYAKLGIDLEFSPDGGARITWPQLLDRLEHGAGAVLLGHDSKLPRWYGRWDVSFWQGLGQDDHHAVYIEGYDRKHGRVWLMDPLGRGDWQGEWISVLALRQFAWTTGGGALSVAVTPTAKAAPYAGLTLGAPAAVVTATAMDVTWSLTAPRTWSFPGADVAALFTTAADPLAAAAIAPAVPPGAMPADPAPAGAPAKPAATVSGGVLRATAPLPTTPGAYLASVTLTDRRFGKLVARSTDIAVFAPGPRRATVSLLVPETQVVAGDVVPVTLSVANTGEETWAEAGWATGGPSRAVSIRDTRVIAGWIPLDVPGLEAPAGNDASAARAHLVPGSVELARVPLAPGRSVQVGVGIVVPHTAGTWALVVDLVDDVDGSFAALGSAPFVQAFDVGEPHRILVVE